MPGLSGHADLQGLLKWYKGINKEVNKKYL
ncbi:MBL fold metallo-hydrolase RNA specificity domain-containing protein [Caloramator sp. Dgby_cultured_2]